MATSTLAATIQHDVTAIITTKNNDWYLLKDTFELVVVAVFHGTGKAFWNGTLREIIHVSCELCEW